MGEIEAPIKCLSKLKLLSFKGGGMVPVERIENSSQGT
jgi:hypothetical protein